MCQASAPRLANADAIWNSSVPGTVHVLVYRLTLRYSMSSLDIRQCMQYQHPIAPHGMR